MLGAAALTSLACLRAGAGLVTVGIPESLNEAVQKKISSAVMTWPLKETTAQTLHADAFKQILKKYKDFNVIAIGPGLSLHPSTQKFVLKVISTSPVPLVIDADALNALAGHLNALKKTRAIKILTPHLGEMARLVGFKRGTIEKNKILVAKKFARTCSCVLLLKGHRTVVASPDGKIYLNRTGNPGMATAGSGDVLTGICAAFAAQVSGFEAAKAAALVHGKAGDLAAKDKGELSLIAPDIIDWLPKAVKFLS